MLSYHTKYNETTKSWQGISFEPLYNPKTSLGNLILNSLARCPSKIGQISHNNGIQLTNEEIRLKSIRTAENLLNLGFQKGDVFAFVTQNTHNLAPVVFGSIIIGAAVGTLDRSFKDAEISHFLRNSKPTLIVCDNDLVERIKNIVNNLNPDLKVNPITVITIDDGHVDGARPISDLFRETGNEKSFRVPDIGDSTTTIAGIITSSGTTGLPKGVCITHANLLAYCDLINYTAEDVLISVTCISWVSAFKTLIGGTLTNSLRIITTDFCTPELTLNMIEKYGVTNFIISPTSLALILQSPAIHTTNLSTIKTIVCGGSSIYPELIQLSRQLFSLTTKLITVYGLSEACGAFSRNADHIDVPKCVGYLVPNVNVTIVNENDELCTIGEIGDIRFKMLYPFLGYHGEDHLTEDAFDVNGFVKTGDIGYFDEIGRLFVVDRKKDMIIYDCNHVSPAEIESVITSHASVSEVCVVGKPDLTYSELPTAVIVRKDGLDVNENEIIDLVRKNMAEWKHLYGGVYFVRHLPKTSSGKIKRRVVREMIINMQIKKK